MKFRENLLSWNNQPGLLNNSMEKTSSRGEKIFSEKIKQRIREEKQSLIRGDNKFKQLEERLRDSDSGELIEDPVIYAIRTIESVSEAKDFVRGYVLNIKENIQNYPEKARENPSMYAKHDIYLALNLHFYSEGTHKIWNSALKG